ncbi:MAG TPA: DUF3106 domain-containing protein [Bryobacteraceae bacterium]|nr:DUF3106 domain-containing protein [Bryobacteraceae bacterium]
MTWRGLVVVLVLSRACPPAFALGPGRPVRQGSPAARRARTPGAAKTPIDEFEQMPPGEQQRALDRLPPAQRQKFQERINRFNRLAPQQQQTLRSLYNRLHQLPSERQEAVRGAIQRFSRQPPERQQAMRDELRGMAALSQQDREARMAGPEFKKRFSGKEQGIVRDMAPLLPPAN